MADVHKLERWKVCVLHRFVLSFFLDAFKEKI